MRAQELPGRFLNTSFTVSEALAGGVTSSRLGVADLRAPSRGIRIPHGADLTLLASLRALTALDDATAVSELTAARARGIPLPFWADQRIHVSRTRGGTHPRRDGVVGHRTLLLPGEVEYLAGVRITSAARTWLDLAHHLPLADLVAAGDHLVSEHGPDHPFPRDPLCTVADLRCVTVAHPKMKGKTNALAALDLIRPGADSAQETRLRLILLDHRVPEPELNVVLYDPWGKPRVWPDLAYQRQRLSIQYDGMVHGADRQYERDIARATITAELGWQELRISAADLRGPHPEVVRKVQQALRAADESP